MKWLSLFIVWLCLFVPQSVRGQIDVKTDPRIAPLLRQAANGQSDLVIFGRKPVSNMYVNMAVLDKTNKTLFWFTRYGTAYDSVRLREIEYAQIASNVIDPFNFYKELCLDNEVYLDEAVAEYRKLGKLALKDTSYNRRIIYSSASVQSAHSTLQQLMAMESLFKKQCLKLCLFNSPSSSLSSSNDGFMLRKSLAGKIVNKPDTTIYYATSPLGLIARTALCRQDSLKMLVYDGQDHVVDSMPLKPGKYAFLLKSKDDVFLLYRGWLELQSQQVQEALLRTAALLHRQDTGLYIQTYRVENRRQLLLAEAQLKYQQQDIEGKISGLMLPDKDMVAHMLQSAYSSEISEITYLSARMGFAYTTSYKRGEKVYELSNHLGNVMAAVSDKKVKVDNGDGAIAYYNVDVVNSNDYYPFGSLIPGRTYNQGEYRYGFNGKEGDDEVKGEGNSVDFGARVYDPRIGRFLSLDPFEKKFPEESPYDFAGNNPISYLDYNGMFKISPFFVKRYPELAKIIRYYLPLLEYNPELRNKWIQNAGYTDLAAGGKAFDEMVTYGKGPYISPTRRESEAHTDRNRLIGDIFDGGSGGEFDGIYYPDNLIIGYGQIEDFEAAVKKGDENAIAEKMFIVTSAIMHESAHYGRSVNGHKRDDDYEIEAGAQFERLVFGTRFSYLHPESSDFRLQNRDVGLLKATFKKLKDAASTVTFGMSIVPNYTNYYQRIKKYPIPAGQAGDKTVTGNNDKE